MRFARDKGARCRGLCVRLCHRRDESFPVCNDRNSSRFLGETLDGPRSPNYISQLVYFQMAKFLNACKLLGAARLLDFTTGAFRFENRHVAGDFIGDDFLNPNC